MEWAKNSDEVASEIDRELRRIVDEAYDSTISLIEENLDKLHDVANALLKFETLDADQFQKAFDGELVVTDEEIEAEEAHDRAVSAGVKIEKDNAASLENALEKAEKMVKTTITKDEE